MAEPTMIIEVDEDLGRAFIEAAKASDRTASQLLQDFMRRYVGEEAEWGGHDAFVQRKVEEGRQAAREGRARSNDDVDASFAARRALSAQKAGERGL